MVLVLVLVLLLPDRLNAVGFDVNIGHDDYYGRDEGDATSGSLNKSQLRCREGIGISGSVPLCRIVLGGRLTETNEWLIPPHASRTYVKGCRPRERETEREDSVCAGCGGVGRSLKCDDEAVIYWCW
jgi:hypothetical protein